MLRSCHTEKVPNDAFFFQKNQYAAEWRGSDESSLTENWHTDIHMEWTERRKTGTLLENTGCIKVRQLISGKKKTKKRRYDVLNVHNEDSTYNFISSKNIGMDEASCKTVTFHVAKGNNVNSTQDSFYANALRQTDLSIDLLRDPWKSNEKDQRNYPTKDVELPNQFCKGKSSLSWRCYFSWALNLLSHREEVYLKNIDFLSFLLPQKSGNNSFMTETNKKLEKRRRFVDILFIKRKFPLSSAVHRESCLTLICIHGDSGEKKDAITHQEF